MRQFPGMPVLASEHGGQIDFLMFLIHNFMLLLFAGWFIFFVYALYRFRRKRNPQARYKPLKSKALLGIEVLVVVVEVVLLVGLAIPFWSREIVAQPTSAENPLEVRVVAQQFLWNIQYPGPDGNFGRVDATLIDAQANPMGLDPDDPHGTDDVVTLNQLYLPVNRPVTVHLTTMDVVHSFFLPEFRVKQDAIPGMSIPVSFTPTMTTAELRDSHNDQARNFEIACAQLCGLGHYRMRGYVTVLAPDAFDTWLNEQVQTAQEAEDEIVW